MSLFGQEKSHLYVLLATRGTQGDLNPLLAIATELIARGHRVTFATRRCYESLVASHGCLYRPLRPDAPPPSARLRPSDRQRAFRTDVLCRVEETYLDLVRASEGADILVGHHVLLPLEMAAAGRGIPWVPTYFAPGALNSIYDPPIIPTLARIHALQRHSHYAAALANVLLKKITKPWYNPYRELRARESFPAEDTNYLLDGAKSPYLNLALFSSFFGRTQPDWNETTAITGFPFLPEEPGPEHNALRSFVDAGPPPIVATLGSSGTESTRHFFEASAEAARRLGRRIVLVTGALPAASLHASDTAIAFATQRVPYGYVFPQACMVIHSGAIGAIAETLRAGKPMLVVPAGAADQPDNAARAVRLGVARTVPMANATADAVSAAVRDVLNEPSYGERAAEAERQIRTENGARRAADLIEQTAFAFSREAKVETRPFAEAAL